MRKSDRTRAGILEAARALFAEHGYEGTTVRAIAERASIDPSMIIRYFAMPSKAPWHVFTPMRRLPKLTPRHRCRRY